MLHAYRSSAYQQDGWQHYKRIEAEKLALMITVYSPGTVF
jgi:hypothetical protein